MEDFSLIQKLNKKNSKEDSPLAEGVTYQQYEIEVDGAVQVVNIPLREALNFESAITEQKNPLTRKSLKLLLREYRGIRG